MYIVKEVIENLLRYTLVDFIYGISSINVRLYVVFVYLPLPLNFFSCFIVIAG